MIQKNEISDIYRAPRHGSMGGKATIEVNDQTQIYPEIKGGEKVTVEVDDQTRVHPGKKGR